jgi:hypothetical protein
MSLFGKNDEELLRENARQKAELAAVRGENSRLRGLDARLESTQGEVQRLLGKKSTLEGTLTEERRNHAGELNTLKTQHVDEKKTAQRKHDEEMREETSAHQQTKRSLRERERELDAEKKQVVHLTAVVADQEKKIRGLDEENTKLIHRNTEQGSYIGTLETGNKDLRLESESLRTTEQLTAAENTRIASARDHLRDELGAVKLEMNDLGEKLTSTTQELQERDKVLAAEPPDLKRSLILLKTIDPEGFTLCMTAEKLAELQFHAQELEKQRMAVERQIEQSVVDSPKHQYALAARGRISLESEQQANLLRKELDDIRILDQTRQSHGFRPLKIDELPGFDDDVKLSRSLQLDMKMTAERIRYEVLANAYERVRNELKDAQYAREADLDTANAMIADQLQQHGKPHMEFASIEEKNDFYRQELVRLRIIVKELKKAEQEPFNQTGIQIREGELKSTKTEHLRQRRIALQINKKKNLAKTCLDHMTPITDEITRKDLISSSDFRALQSKIADMEKEKIRCDLKLLALQSDLLPHEIGDVHHSGASPSETSPTDYLASTYDQLLLQAGALLDGLDQSVPEERRALQVRNINKNLLQREAEILEKDLHEENSKHAVLLVTRDEIIADVNHRRAEQRTRLEAIAQEQAKKRAQIKVLSSLESLDTVRREMEVARDRLQAEIDRLPTYTADQEPLSEANYHLDKDPEAATNGRTIANLETEMRRRGYSTILGFTSGNSEEESKMKLALVKEYRRRAKIIDRIRERRNAEAAKKDEHQGVIGELNLEIHQISEPGIIRPRQELIASHSAQEMIEMYQQSIQQLEEERMNLPSDRVLLAPVDVTDYFAFDETDSEYRRENALAVRLSETKLQQLQIKLQAVNTRLKSIRQEQELQNALIRFDIDFEDRSKALGEPGEKFEFEDYRRSSDTAREICQKVAETYRDWSDSIQLLLGDPSQGITSVLEEAMNIDREVTVEKIGVLEQAINRLSKEIEVYQQKLPNLELENVRDYVQKDHQQIEEQTQRENSPLRDQLDELIEKAKKEHKTLEFSLVHLVKKVLDEALTDYHGHHIEHGMRILTRVLDATQKNAERLQADLELRQERKLRYQTTQGVLLQSETRLKNSRSLLSKKEREAKVARERLQRLLREKKAADRAEREALPEQIERLESEYMRLQSDYELALQRYESDLEKAADAKRALEEHEQHIIDTPWFEIQDIDLTIINDQEEPLFQALQRQFDVQNGLMRMLLSSVIREREENAAIAARAKDTFEKSLGPLSGLARDIGL